MSSTTYPDSHTIPEWSTWLPSGPATNDILSTRIDMANIFLQGEAALQTTACPPPGDNVQGPGDGQGGATFGSLRDMQRRYSSGVNDLYNSTVYAIEAAIYFSVLEAITCGALIRLHGLTKAGQAISHLLVSRLRRLESLAKDRAAHFLIIRGIENIHQFTITTGIAYLVDRICANALVQVLYNCSAKVFGDDYIYRLAWMTVKTVLFFMVVFQVLVLECGARIAWIVLCSVCKCFMATPEKAEGSDRQPPETSTKPSDRLPQPTPSSTRAKDVLVCLLCLLAIPVGFASFYFELETFDSPKNSSTDDDCKPKEFKKKKTRVKTSDSKPRKASGTKPDAEALPDPCPIVMEPLDGDEPEETKIGVAPDESEETRSLKPADDACPYDQYADELELLMRAGRPPWNVESSPEEDSVIIDTDQDAQRMEPAFLAGRFPATPPVSDTMSALVGFNILLGLMQMHMAANGNAAVENNTPATDKKSISLGEVSPVGGESFPNDQNMADKSLLKVSNTIASTVAASSPSKIIYKRGINSLRPRSISLQDVHHQGPVVTTNGRTIIKKGGTVGSQSDSTENDKREQPGLLEHWDANDSLTEVSQMLLDKTNESPSPAILPVAQRKPVPEINTAPPPDMLSPTRESQKTSLQPPKAAEISWSEPSHQISQSHQPPRKLSISETSSVTTVSSGTTTVVSSEPFSPCPTSSSLRSVTTSMKKLTLAATAPPFVPRHRLSMSSASVPPPPPPLQSLPLGVGMANRPPSDLWSPAPKVPINICPPPPKKRRVRGRGRKALEAVASAAMSSMANENTGPSSRAMDINL